MSGKNLYCNFCGKESADVQHMVAGPDVMICDECIVQCWEIIDPIKRGVAEYESWTFA